MKWSLIVLCQLLAANWLLVRVDLSFDLFTIDQHITTLATPHALDPARQQTPVCQVQLPIVVVQWSHHHLLSPNNINCQTELV